MNFMWRGKRGWRKIRNTTEVAKRYGTLTPSRAVGGWGIRLQTGNGEIY